MKIIIQLSVLFVFTFGLENIPHEVITKLSYDDYAYLNKEVNSGVVAAGLVVPGVVTMYSEKKGAGAAIFALGVAASAATAFGIIHPFGLETNTISYSETDDVADFDGKWIFGKMGSGDVSVTGSQKEITKAYNKYNYALIGGGIVLAAATRIMDVVIGKNYLEKKQARILYNAVKLSMSCSSDCVGAGLAFRF